MPQEDRDTHTKRGDGQVATEADIRVLQAKEHLGLLATTREQEEVRKGSSQGLRSIRARLALRLGISSLQHLREEPSAVLRHVVPELCCGNLRTLTPSD